MRPLNRKAGSQLDRLSRNFTLIVAIVFGIIALCALAKVRQFDTEHPTVSSANDVAR
ncbi:MAG: hypothetical protein JST51_20305 [Armatimonadetes bacterium]|nr:hypothetical protein [Armatimonadota bacterium]